MSVITTGSNLKTNPNLNNFAKTLFKDIADPGRIGGDRFFKKHKISGVAEEFYTTHGADMPVPLSETADPPTTQPVVGFSKSVRTFLYGQAMTYSKEALQQDPGRLVGDRETLMDGKRRFIELQLALFVTTAIEGSTATLLGGKALTDNNTIDGLPYFHSAHTFASGGVTNSNLSSAERTVSLANLESMRLQARGWFDQRGVPMGSKVTGWICGIHNTVKLRALHMPTQDPESDLNAYNQLKVKDGTGTAPSGVDEWELLPRDEFMAACAPKPGLPCWLHAYQAGYENDVLDYTSPSGIRRTIGYRYKNLVTAISPYGHITRRVAS